MSHAQIAVRKLGFEPVENPFVALQWVAGETMAIKDVLRGEVERLESLRYQGAAGEQIRGELAAYQAALRDTVNVLSIMAKLEVDVHLARIEEAKAQILIEAVVGAMEDVGITGGLALRLREAVADRLDAANERRGGDR